VRNHPVHLWGGHLRNGGGLLPWASILLLGGMLSIVTGVPAAAGTPVSKPGAVPRGPGLAMLVSPPRLIVAASQIAKTQRLEIENRGAVRLDVRARLEAVGQRANGSALLESAAPYSAVNWVTLMPDHLYVDPGTRRYIQVRFHVPPDPEPGDHYVAIILTVPPRPGKGNIHIVEGIGVPTLITVPGPVTDNVGVTGLTAPGFSAGGPISLAATVSESGDVHHSFTGPHGRLAARAGDETILFPPITVLRGSTITMTTKWANPPLVCVCHVTTAVLSDGHRTVATATVIIFPVIQVLSGIGILLALVLAFLVARRYQQRRLAGAYQAGRRFDGPGEIPPDPALGRHAL
jgi:hypothetical protein